MLPRDFAWQSSGPVRVLCRLIRAGGVGAAATVVDVVVLAALVEVWGLAPAVAGVPSLLAGGLVQFIGSRRVVFPGAERGRVGAQMASFAVVEAGTLLLNAGFYALLEGHLGVPYGIARLVGTALVYFGFSYPLWHLVFRGRERGALPSSPRGWRRDSPLAKGLPSRSPVAGPLAGGRSARRGGLRWDGPAAPQIGPAKESPK